MCSNATLQGQSSVESMESCGVLDCCVACFADLSASRSNIHVLESAVQNTNLLKKRLMMYCGSQSGMMRAMMGSF